MFKNNEYSVSLLEENGQITNVRIVSNHKIFQFSPYLITINGSIPEGTFRDDYIIAKTKCTIFQNEMCNFFEFSHPLISTKN